MKKNDIAAIILIVAFSGIISYFIANAVIGKPSNDPVQVEQITPVGETFPVPDSRVFNDEAVDPTVEISGDGQSTDQVFAN
jgi:hypothetical protein